MHATILAGASAWRCATASLFNTPCTDLFDGMCKLYVVNGASIYVIASTQLPTASASELAFNVVDAIENLAGVCSAQMIASSVFQSNGIKSWSAGSTPVSRDLLKDDVDINNHFAAVVMKLFAFSALPFNATIHPEKREKFSKMLEKPDSQSIKVLHVFSFSFKLLIPIAELLVKVLKIPVNQAFTVSQEAVAAIEEAQKKVTQMQETPLGKSAQLTSMYI